jgi:DNA repair exonuclease SbcCD nuclease subunit
VKVAIIADTHLGVRNDNKRWLDNQCRFFDEVFFPELARRGVKAIVHLGDLVDRRKYVQYQTANVLRRHYLEPASEYEHYVIVGNHDIALRDSLAVNALRELGVDNYANIYERSANVRLGSLTTFMLPWLTATNVEEELRMIEGTNAEVCFAHLELAGFEHYKGQVAQKGMSRKVFERFDRVYTGHFHEPSSQGNVTYVGAPYEMTWADAGCQRGFTILDTETRETEFVPNPLTLYAKLQYTDDAAYPEWEWYRDKIVRVNVAQRENNVRFDKWMQELDGVGADITVIEDRLSVTSLDEVAQIKAGDTLQTMEQYVNETFIGEDADRADLLGILSETYRDALEKMQ